MLRRQPVADYDAVQIGDVHGVDAHHADIEDAVGVAGEGGRCMRDSCSAMARRA